MKEVKLFQFLTLFEITANTDGGWHNDEGRREEFELNLASWLEARWSVAGSGGASLSAGFVVLVRDG